MSLRLLFWIIQMSRYVNKQPTVSQEGFFGAVGKFLAAAGSAYSRSVILGSIDWSGDFRPEVNGSPQKNYQQMINSLSQVIAGGEVWDLTLHSDETDVDGNNAGSMLILIGQGKDVRVRLPGYANHGYAPHIANLIIADLKLKQVA